MVIFQKTIVSLLLLAVITGVLFLYFMTNNKAEKILGRILLVEAIALIISLFVLIWIS